MGLISNPAISKKSKLAPENSDFSIKKPVIKIFKRNVIPVRIIVDISQYVRKFTFIVRNFKKGSVIIIPILKINRVERKYKVISGIRIPVNIVEVKKKINKKSNKFLKYLLITLL